MPSSGVLAIGCASGPNYHLGIEADGKVIHAHCVLADTIATAVVDNNGRGLLIESDPAGTATQIKEVMRIRDYSVVKIGSILSPEVIQATSCMLQTHRPTCVVDLEPWFHSMLDIRNLQAAEAAARTAFREHILPHTTILSGSVDDALALLADAGAPVPHPRDISDIKLMCIALRYLGPEYVVIKEEFCDDEEKTSLLMYVLCGPLEPVYETMRCNNPNVLEGIKYSIPASIAACLAKDYDVPGAVAAAFEYAQEKLKTGMF